MDKFQTNPLTISLQGVKRLDFDYDHDFLTRDNTGVLILKQTCHLQTHVV